MTCQKHDLITILLNEKVSVWVKIRDLCFSVQEYRQELFYVIIIFTKYCIYISMTSNFFGSAIYNINIMLS